MIFCLLLFMAEAKGQDVWTKGKTTPSIALKSNILYDVTTNMNIGVEFKVTERLTLEVPVSYNPWSFSDNRQWKHILTQPELKWWLCESFNGHFFGIHAHYASYNASNFGTRWMRDHRFEGWLAGGGLTYGYQFFLSKRWNLEASVGFGYTHFSYDRYGCEECAAKIDSRTTGFVGPTKLALSLIYIIK